ncbi:MAG: fructose-bisphosphatase class I, partial [Chitinophagales bacterium]
MKIQKVVTLEDFIATSQMGFSFATGELSGLLRDISLAAKMVNRAINKAGLVDILGLEGNENVQGEEVKKLDVFANEHFIHALSISGQCAGIASEEEEDFITIKS